MTDSFEYSQMDVADLLSCAFASLCSCFEVLDHAGFKAWFDRSDLVAESGRRPSGAAS